MGEFRRELLPEPEGYFEAQGLVLKGRGAWRTTTCAFHGGRATLRVNVITGGFICMGACGARGGDVLAYQMAAHGQDFVAAARALGAYVEDAQPHRGPTRPTPLPARAALEVLAFEAQLAAVAAANLAAGAALSDADRKRLATAATRIATVQEMFS